LPMYDFFLSSAFHAGLFILNPFGIGFQDNLMTRLNQVQSLKLLAKFKIVLLSNYLLAARLVNANYNNLQLPYSLFINDKSLISNNE